MGAAKKTRDAKQRGKTRDRAAKFLLLRDPETGETRRIKQGFAWTLFLFSGVLGLPLFLRGLYRWGAAVLGLWGIDLLAVWLTTGGVRVASEAVLFGVFLCLQFWLGLTGNALTIKAYRDRGWAPAR